MDSPCTKTVAKLAISCLPQSHPACNVLQSTGQRVTASANTTKTPPHTLLPCVLPNRWQALGITLMLCSPSPMPPSPCTPPTCKTKQPKQVRPILLYPTQAPQARRVFIWKGVVLLLMPHRLRFSSKMPRKTMRHAGVATMRTSSASTGERKGSRTP